MTLVTLMTLKYGLILKGVCSSIRVVSNLLTFLTCPQVKVGSY
jgi:hypothetical protein